MTRYPSYKPTGIEWIGDIPEHWVISKLKYDSSTPVKYGLNISGDNYKEEGVRFIRITDLTDEGELINEDGKYLEEGVVPQEFLLEKYDVLFCRSGHTVGKSYLHLLEGKFTSGGYLVRFNFRNYTESKFISYLNKTQLYWDWIKLNTVISTIENVNGDKYQNFQYPKPPLLEQQQIVIFLDKKVEVINKLISTKERKIELLKEQRTSLINQVITKGLDPNVKMKKSGIEWIGEIPEHWGSFGFTKIIKIRHGFQFREYDFTDEGIKVVKITQLDRDGYLNLENCSFISKDRIEEFGDIVIRENDVLMCLTGGTIGKIIKVGKVDEPLVQNYRVGHFSSNNNSILNNYIFWFMSSDVLVSQIFYEIRETGQPNIGIEDFRRMKIILPPISEQIKIIEFLDTHTKELDEMVLLEQKKIDLLKEYRQSLISEVVTGKIDVRRNVN